MQLPQLPAYYYLQNFHSVLDWVSARYADLLSVDESAFIVDFKRLGNCAQALLVRLIMRKGRHFRLARLSYPEIGDLEHAAVALLRAGWLCDDCPIDAAELCALLRREELVEHFPQYVSHRSIAKSELTVHLTSIESQSKSFRQWCPKLNDRLLTLTVTELADRLRLMFFGNMRQDWSEFVLADLGVFRYEQVAFSTASRGFHARRDIDDFLHLHRCRESFERGQPVPDVLALIEGFCSDNRQIRARHAKLLFYMGQHLERAGDFEAALPLYERSIHPGARQRRIRILEKLGQVEQAWQLAQAAMANPESDAERQLVQRAINRLSPKRGGRRIARTRPAEHGLLELCLPRPDTGTVEHAVREHLSQPDTPVFYVENTLLNSLFGLLCWEAIFAPLPGAFFHPFQGAPADLLDIDFHARRRALFDDAFAQLDSESYRARIRTTFINKYGLQSPFVCWGALDESLLDIALACIPPWQLKACFQRLLGDIKANRAGMPDLIQFWPAERRYRMIEVKGPGDRLQDNQRRWLAFCAEQRMPVDVCYVRWIDA